MSIEPDWSLYRTLLALLEEGSLSGAARALGLTQPTVGRHLDQLESALGQRLFVRTQRGLSPTQAAAAIRPFAEAMAAAGAALRRAASTGRTAVAGTVRVSASEVIAVERLPPILAGLRASHPAVAVELVVSNAVEDLLRRDADIAVRNIDPTQGALVARRVGTVEIGLHASPAYLARRGAPASLAEVANFDFVGYDRGSPAVRAILDRFPELPRARVALATDSDLAQLASIRAGFGIGACQVGLPGDAGLVRLLPQAFALELPVWVAMHEDLRSDPRCRTAFDALAAGLAAQLGRGPGHLPGHRRQ